MSSEQEMKVDPTRAAALVSQIKGISERIGAAANGRNVRLVAVSKLKPANDILALHQQYGQLHFGENYAQEMQAKAELLPRSIKWHFIGGLQSGHCKNLAKIPNLWCVSSVDTTKKVQLLDQHRGNLISSFTTTTTSSSSDGQSAAAPAPEPLNIHIQINTSGEAAKSGCSPGTEALELCRLVRSSPNLNLLGVMTIGAIARSKAATATTGEEGQEEEKENEDFVLLKQQRDMLVKELGLVEGLELSMGMSEDFEGAVKMGSDEVRVGSTIFGTRPPKGEAKVKE